MTEKQVKQLTDIGAFIEWSILRSKGNNAEYVTFGWVLSNLAHDIGGLIREDKWFCPRTEGYADALGRYEQRSV